MLLVDEIGLFGVFAALEFKLEKISDPKKEKVLNILSCHVDKITNENIELLDLFINDKLHEIEFPLNTFSFMFLGTILVTYHNASLSDTFGKNCVSPVSWKITDLNGKTETHISNVLTGDIAGKIRNREIQRIEVELC